jgi:hypothetical protein
MSESPSVALTPRQKRKASQIGGDPPTGPGLAENRRVVVSDPETRTRTTIPLPKRLKRSYAFHEPLSASKRPNVTRGKQIYCEELTTYETREVVAVPNSRSMGGV